MSTLTIPRDRLAAELRPADQITAIDGRPADHRVAGITRLIINAAGGIRLHNPAGITTETNLYPDTQVAQSVTIERVDETPEPESTPAAEPADLKVPLTTSDYQVGDPVLVFAWGQFRRGKVTKIGRTRLTIEHRRNAAGDRHERAFGLGEIVRGWSPHPWTPGIWTPRMADGTPGRDHIGLPPTIPTRPRTPQAAPVAAPDAARTTGKVTLETPRTADLRDRLNYSPGAYDALEWGDKARTLLRRTPGYVAVLREAADCRNGVLTVSGDNSDRRSTGTSLGFAARYGWARQLDTNPGVWQITQAGLDVILAWDAEQEETTR